MSYPANDTNCCCGFHFIKFLISQHNCQELSRLNFSGFCDISDVF